MDLSKADTRLKQTKYLVPQVSALDWFYCMCVGLIREILENIFVIEYVWCNRAKSVSCNFLINFLKSSIWIFNEGFLESILKVILNDCLKMHEMIKNNSTSKREFAGKGIRKNDQKNGIHCRVYLLKLKMQILILIDWSHESIIHTEDT